MLQPFLFFYVFPCIEFLVTRDQHVTWRIGFVSAALCSNFFNGLGRWDHEQFDFAAFASRFTSFITGSLPYAPVPTTSRRHFQGMPSSMERGVCPNSWGIL